MTCLIDAEMKEIFGMILGKLDSLDKKVIKNSLELESMQSDMKTIIKVQRSQSQELNRKLDDISDDIKKDISLHSTAIKDVSIDVRKLEEGQISLEKDVSALIRRIG